jgi:CubicO group peptidase (beta-lactamase class C family)
MSLRTPFLAASAGLALSAVVLAATPSDSPLPQSSPESVGLSASRLAHFGEYFRGKAASQAAPGYVMMIARYGKLVYTNAVGEMDIARHEPMNLTTRFRMASMTKPVTSVAVLMLYEEGRLHLDDPLSDFLPEFAHMRVATGTDAQGNITTEPAKSLITIRQLLTHTSGLGYGPGYDASALGKAYADLNLTHASSLAEAVRRLASAPLYFQPGEGWRYSYAHDVLGRLVEVVSGMPFDEFLRARLFEPLGMRSTGFHIAPEDRSRLASVYRHDSAGKLVALEPTMLGDPTDQKAWPSGGGGLISTAGDYLLFAQMLANGGSLNHRQYLSPVTVGLMTHNQVPADAMYKFWGESSVGLGYGLGVGVEIDAAHAPQATLDGDYEWGGVFDTHWLVSPKSGIVAVLLTQVAPVGATKLERTDVDFRNLLFGAVESLTPQKTN